MSLATDIRTRAEEALDRTTTTFTGLAGELRSINVNDVTSVARDFVAAVPTVDVQRLVGTVDGYRKAAQEQVDELLHADPRVGKVADTVEDYRKAAAEQVEALFGQLRQDPRVGKVIETVDDKLVKPARARFVSAENVREDEQAVATNHEAPVQVRPAPAQVKPAQVKPAQVKPAPAKAARKAPARKTTPTA